MSRRRFALERGGPKRLELRWKGRLKEFRVQLDGQSWTLEPAAVTAGTSLAIPGGSSLFVQVVKRRWWSIALRDELRVDRDGVPVPGSDGDPRLLARRAAGVIGLFGLLRLLAGYALLDRGRGVPLGAAGAGGWLVASDGAILVVLAILTAFGLRLPVVLAAGLLALELVASLALVGGASGAGTVVQVLVIVHLYQAWRSMEPRVPTASLASVFE